ncbi:organomercurial lyase MerB [Mycobacteroides abscessus]|uniref:organomercurial lyase MerB n=1 Tax=Mycobacteroides abscessus TaxID=36809 RepID=UPI00092A635E|nr:organomercurial lyase MerB [Mycobacteroides abscessus]SIE96307.1 Alkylmercury lyase/Helix-turn-helix domain of alkylmercury lyase [Mycobacteroides abscessus subsp. abscessus]
MRIELLTAPDCPHAASARQLVTDCLSSMALDLPIIERVGRYPSPTVLVDGADVMCPAATVLAADACRLDLPTPERLLTALRANSADHLRDAARKEPLMCADPGADSVSRDTDQKTRRHLMRTAVRLLAGGGPVTVADLCAAAGVDRADLTTAPAGRDIEYDDHHRIIGWGLTLNPSPHVYIVDGQHLYTWCAADTLLFPVILDRRAQIESRCPTTDIVVSFTVDPRSGVTDLSPSTAVISIPGSQTMDSAAVRATICDPGRFFANPQAADDWLTAHPGGTVLPVANAYPQLRLISGRLLD